MFRRPRSPSSFDASGIDFSNVRPWWRPASDRLGLQGQLVLTFSGLLAVALGASCWVLVVSGGQRMNEMLAAEARQLTWALGLAGEEALRHERPGDLKRIGHDLIRTRNILFVGYLDASGRPVALASRDTDKVLAPLNLGLATHSLMQVRRKNEPPFGNYFEVAAPVLCAVTEAAADTGDAHTSPSRRLVGYVVVGMSPTQNQAQLRAVGYQIAIVGGVMVLASMPLSWLVVHRIFLPIRALAAASRRIAEEDMDATVKDTRLDALGDLARAFNGMVRQVRQQKQNLRSVNDQLAEANRTLERKVEERTRQVETAAARLESEVTEKEDFLRAVSHDLNAPLRNIDGMITMLLKKHRPALEAIGGEVIHRLERVKKNVEVETDLITELLDLSRIKTRRQTMEMVDVERLIWELRGIFENDLRTRAIELVLESDLPQLWCERARLRQVFQNLIDNAIKYMGASVERRIGVGASLDRARGEMEFRVTDTGPGFDPADAQKLFYVFRRGKGQETANVPGKGVGLASVKSIVETYGGMIRAEVRPGGGAVFRFTINGRYVPALCPDGPADFRPPHVADETPNPDRAAA